MKLTAKVGGSAADGKHRQIPTPSLGAVWSNPNAGRYSRSTRAAQPYRLKKHRRR